MRLLFILIVLPLVATSQQVYRTEIKSTQKKIMYTSHECLIKSLGTRLCLSLKFDTTFYSMGLSFSTMQDYAAVKQGNELIFFLDNGEKVTVKNYEGFGQTSSLSASFYYGYIIAKADIETLAAHDVVSFKWYTEIGPSIFSVPKRKKNALKKLSILFLAELNK